MHFTQGAQQAVSAAQPETIQSYVWFVAPVNADVIESGSYEVNSESGSVTVRFYQVEHEKDDAIFQNTKQFVLIADENGKPFVPTRYLTDNKGHYPCTAVEVRFPYLLAGDSLQPPDKPFSEAERERMELLGPEPMPEKIAALLAANRAIKQYGSNKGRAISASEVTALITVQEQKEPRQLLTKTISLVTTENAFKDAAADYYLGEAKETVALSLALLRKAHPHPPSNEAELHNLVLSSIDQVLVHHIETRRLVDPFWDGSRKIKINGNEIEIPRIPKGETEIQPTLHVFLQMALKPFGVHVIRESDEGSGSLDFRFSTTTPASELVSVAAEFKLAQHKEVKAGISRQLPRYMDSIPCTHGIFVLMWFKDENGKYFSEPKAQDLATTRSFLNELASNPENKDHVIDVRVIDCSIRPSASQLR